MAGELNPYESSHTPTSTGEEPRPSEGYRELAWIARVQAVGVLGLALFSLHDIRYFGEVPGVVLAVLTFLLSVPAAISVFLLFAGPLLWLFAIALAIANDPPRPWWFIFLEPLLWGATLLAMLPAVQ